MEPRQWLLDQNSNIHRVAAAYRENDNLANPLVVELVQPIASLSGAKAQMPSSGANPPQPVTAAVVQRIHYIPLRDGEFSLTPVYVTVKEL
jgi:hypothetical protein